MLNFEQIVGIRTEDFYNPEALTIPNSLSSDPERPHGFAVILTGGPPLYLITRYRNFATLLNAYEAWLTER